MKKVVFFGLLFINACFLIAQENLVLNGDFENFTSLPNTLQTRLGIQNFLKDVYTPYFGNSPDYYNYKNSISQVKYPYLLYPPNFLFNTTGDSIYKNIIPKSGNGFAGIGNELGYYPNSSNPISYFIESIALVINKPLRKNHKYSGSFFYNNFGRQSFVIVDLGMLLTNDTAKLNIKSQDDYIPIYFGNKVQVLNKTGKIISKDTWVQIVSAFKANGGEQTAIIGYLKSNNSIEDIDSSYALIEPSFGNYRFRNYFFIDSVTLFEIPCLVAPDTVCQGEEVNLYSTLKGNHVWTQQADSLTGVLTTDTFHTFTANQTGWYYVFSTTGKDSAYITVLPTPIVQLGNDTFYCNGDSIMLIPTLLHTNNYTWQDGSKLARYAVTQTGKYSITATNGWCAVSDSVMVSEKPFPEKLAVHDITICTTTEHYQTLNLDIKNTYKWSPLVDVDNGVAIFTKEGCFHVLIQSEFGCAITDSICVEDVCKPLVFVPNAFVPDGVNKVFQPTTTYVSTIYWEVYNKWGQLIFETSDLMGSWDGSYNNKPCPSDVYFYKLIYKGLMEEEEQSISGNVTLIR